MSYRRFTFIAALAVATGFAVACSTTVIGRQHASLDTGIKYVRDSEEYATLARQVYRLATDAVTHATPASSNRPWAVVLDIDETALDNSTYQVERAGLGLSYDDASWDAWVKRREAPAVPGVVDFVKAARRAGAHIAWITNRSTAARTATQDNLESVGLWNGDDRLCTQNSSTHTKRIRRGEVLSGQGDCAWSARPMTVGVFVGDQLGDFPERDENVPNAGTDAAFGRMCFLLPNSMYGSWTTKVTRIR
jgi:5'-nucleotidase (lipoprotein e(P4) family)